MYPYRMDDRTSGPLLAQWPDLDSTLRRSLTPPARSLPTIRLGAAAASSLRPRAEDALGAPWPALPASAWARFHRDGDRLEYEAQLFARSTRLSRACLMAAATGQERWLDEVGDGLIAVCEQSSWCWPAHDDSWERTGRVLPEPSRPFLDLGAGETAAQLAWIDHLIGRRLDRRLPGIRARLRHEVHHRVLTPFESRSDWHWLGLDQPIHNWAPWIAGNLLTAALRLVDDPSARVRLVRRSIAALDRYAAALPPDGACDEGQGYWWNGPCRLLEALELLRQATGGELDARSVPRLRRTVAFPQSCHLGGPWYVNHADASAKPGADQPWHCLWRLGELFADQGARNQAVIGQSHSGQSGGGWPAAPADGLGRMALALADADWRRRCHPAADQPALPLAVWHPSTGVMVARQVAGASLGLSVVAKGGHNGEPHNHNDVGSVIVALDGTPVLVDAGRPTYTAQTFGPQRYDIWSVRSQWHNLPLIAGQGQGVGRAYGAAAVSAVLEAEAAVFEAELAGAYDVPELASWRRTVRLDRTSQTVVIADSWRWRDHQRAKVELRLLLAGEVTAAAAGQALVTTLAGAGFVLAWPADWGFRLVERRLDDPAHSQVWGSHLTQLRLDAGGARQCEVVCRRLAGPAQSKTNNSVPHRL
ncbi:MAG: heparinase II/III-family protein [Bifidobacteriaceae bacterium]|jgi:hypothetical protein|nr:heparinase II/III-family protein [Bifidobacteriaceae bacterium]